MTPAPGEPDGLGRALVRLSQHGAALPGAEWAAIYAIVDVGVGGGEDGASPPGGRDALDEAVPLPGSLQPPLEKRLTRLQRLGFAGHAPGPWWRQVDGDRAWWGVPIVERAITGAVLLLVLGPVLAILLVVGVVGFAFSVGVGFVFYTFVALPPTMVLHTILRAIA